MTAYIENTEIYKSSEMINFGEDIKYIYIKELGNIIKVTPFTCIRE